MKLGLRSRRLSTRAGRRHAGTDHLLESADAPHEDRWQHHAKDFKGSSVELDAIPIPQLHQLVRDIVDRHIDERQLAVLRTAEESERELIRGLARGAAA